MYKSASSRLSTSPSPVPSLNTRPAMHPIDHACERLHPTAEVFTNTRA